MWGITKEHVLAIERCSDEDFTQFCFGYLENTRVIARCNECEVELNPHNEVGVYIMEDKLHYCDDCFKLLYETEDTNEESN